VPFDFDDAMRRAELASGVTSSRTTYLAHPRIHEWIRKASERVQLGKMTWRDARAVIVSACEAEGIDPPKHSYQVIAAYARRKFRE